VRDFQAALPEATVYVYDNNSTDGTVPAARSAGAVVVHEGRQGKGFVVRRSEWAGWGIGSWLTSRRKRASWRQ
jgi:hypothetical protein